jgi:hypothetical protein
LGTAHTGAPELAVVEPPLGGGEVPGSDDGGGSVPGGFVVSGGVVDGGGVVGVHSTTQPLFGGGAVVVVVVVGQLTNGMHACVGDAGCSQITGRPAD